MNISHDRWQAKVREYILDGVCLGQDADLEKVARKIRKATARLLQPS